MAKLAIQSLDEARAIARLLDEGKITGAGRDRALADLRAFDHQQRNLENIRKDEAANDPTSEMSGTDKFLAGVGSGMTAVGRGVYQANERLGSVLAPHPGQRAAHAAQAKELERREAMARETDAPLNATGAGKAGRIAGELITTAPLGAVGGTLAKGATLGRTALAGVGTGAAAGAVMPTVSGKEALANIALGGGLGGVLPGALGVLGREAGAAARAPLSNVERAMRELQDEGIVLTRADTLRHPAAQSLARTGLDTTLGQAGRASGEAVRDKSMVRAILKHIGVKADDASPEILGQARQRIGSQFDKVYSPSIKVGLNDDAVAELTLIEAERLPHDINAARAVKRELENVASAFRFGKIPGTAVQGVVKRLKDRASAAKRGGQLEAADVYSDIINVLEEATFDAAGPEAKKALELARRQWRNLKAIERAADRDWSGGISPRKLAAYLAGNRYTKGTYANAPVGTLERLARNLDTIADKFPNSGTPARISPMMEAGAAIGTGGATLPVSGGNYVLQRVLGSAAPRVGAREASKTAQRLGQNAHAGIPAGVAALAPLVEALRDDPASVQAVLGTDPALLSQLLRQGGGVPNELAAMFQKHGGR